MTTNVLLYERPFSAKLFRDVIQKVHGESDVTGISSYRRSSDIWSGEYLYDASLDYDPGISEEEIQDIIVRDRSLVSMDPARARRIVGRFWNGAKRLFENEDFDYLYTLSIDCYEIDILLRLAEIYGVIPISFLGSFLGGYAWMTLRGERHSLGRDVSELEAKNVLADLLQTYYLPPSEKRNVKRSKRDTRIFYLRRKLVESVYNPIQKIVQRDPDNLHYNIDIFQNIGYSDLMDNHYDARFHTLDDLSINRTVTIYYPLHFTPEATTSYWCKNAVTHGYESYVLSFIERADTDVVFLIKEHPAMYGKRPLSFYDRLGAIPNVRLIHPLESSNELLERVDNVLVDNGTVGVEALIRGKRVLSLEDNYYSALHPNISVVDKVTMRELEAPLDEYDSLKFIKALLDGLFPSDYHNDKLQDECSAEQIADGVKLHLEQLKD